jgi:translation elongation factor EF-1beta
MDTLGSETQPLSEDIGFGLMPLLTKVWWDRDKMSELRAYRQRFYKIINSGGTDRTV